MAYVQFSAYPVTVLHVHQCLTNPRFLVYHQRKKARYQPVTTCTYWPVLGSFKNWNIIEITPKFTTFEAFDEIHQVFLDGISDNMPSLVQSVMYGAINTDDTIISGNRGLLVQSGMYDSMNTYETISNGLYVIQFTSEAYTLQNSTKIDVKVISAGELVVKSKFICSMQ